MSPSERSDRDPSHLRAVPSAREERPEPAARRSGARIPTLLAVALLVALVSVALVARRAARLEGEVASLEASLAQTRAALEAQRHRLAEARTHVADLRGRVEILDALLAEDPAAPAPGP